MYFVEKENIFPGSDLLKDSKQHSTRTSVPLPNNLLLQMPTTHETGKKELKKNPLVEYKEEERKRSRHCVLEAWGGSQLLHFLKLATLQRFFEQAYLHREHPPR